MMIIGLINKMVVEYLKIRNKSKYFWNDMIYLDDFALDDLLHRICFEKRRV